MKAWYRTTFADGSTAEGEHDTADQAKAAAKNERIRQHYPGNSGNPADVRTDARVRVLKVEEFTKDAPAAAPPAATPAAAAPATTTPPPASRTTPPAAPAAPTYAPPATSEPASTDNAQPQPPLVG